MTNVNEMIKEILKANEENKLAVFIGAGVSVNSGFKLWWEIVDTFNKDKKYINNGENDYSDEEILKIPQFAYNENPELYFQILEKEYNRLPKETNPIINHLLELQPNHIITTNYDRLIEYSIEKQHIYGNTMYEDFSKYSRIINDTGFISAQKPHYFIKMHGDLDDRDSIVLKEDDYLEFSTSHSLMETFIKSLFVNHTILFAGYGLKDNNLKLIMSWVNNFTKKDVEGKNTNKYYYINVEDTELSKYEKEYYAKKNIYIIEASAIPEMSEEDRKLLDFDDRRGENLYKVVKYLKDGPEMSLEDIYERLVALETMNTITVHELYAALDLYISVSQIINGVEYRFPGSISIFDKITTELQNYPNSKVSNLLKKSFLKAGIRGIVLAEKAVEPSETQYKSKIGFLEMFWMQPKPEYDILWLGEIENDFYELMLSHDFLAMQDILAKESGSVDQLLKQAYLQAYFGENEQAKLIYEKIDEKLKNEKLSFQYIITLFNLGIWEFSDRRYFKLHKMMAEKHQSQFYTLVQFYDDFPLLAYEAVKVDTQIRKEISVVAITRSSDLEFTEYVTLRGALHQNLKYLTTNYIFTLGLGGGGYTRKWFDIIEIYLNTTLNILSPNSNMQVSPDYQYQRIQLMNEDIYFLTVYLDSRTLEFYLEEHRIKSLTLQEEQQEFLIKQLGNIACFDILPRRRNNSQLAKLLGTTMLVVGYTKIFPNKLEKIFRHLELLINNLFTFVEDDTDYTFFHQCYSSWIKCLYGIVKKTEDKSLIQNQIKLLIQSLLVHLTIAYTDDEKDIGFQIYILIDQKILLNLSNVLDYYFNETLDDVILIDFLNVVELYEIETRNASLDFIIELFPAMSRAMKERYRSIVYDSLHNLELQDIKLALEGGVISYDKTIEQLLINSYYEREDSDERMNDPLYIIPRLCERNIIRDLTPYKIFQGQDDFFDFVCFPEEFNYEKFNTAWSTWLGLEKYSNIALEQAFDILKKIYEDKMSNAPTEADKKVYYKYFC